MTAKDPDRVYMVEDHALPLSRQLTSTIDRVHRLLAAAGVEELQIEAALDKQKQLDEDAVFVGRQLPPPDVAWPLVVDRSGYFVADNVPRSAYASRRCVEASSVTGVILARGSPA